MIEGIWSQFRREMPKNGIREKFIDDYISSFVFSKTRELSFVETVKAICRYKPEEFIEEEEEDNEEDDDEEDVPVMLTEDEATSDNSLEVSDGAEHSEYEPE